MNKELKTLFIFIRFYDYSYGYGAYIFKNKFFEEVSINEELYDLLNYIGCCITCNSNFKLSKEKLNDYYMYSNNTEEKVDNAMKLINNLFETYENVVICDNGFYTYFDKSMVEKELLGVK